MDKAGIIQGQGENGLVVGYTGNRFIQKKQPGSHAWVTFFECISALGKALLPLVIFKGKLVQQQWFPFKLDQYKGWKFNASENGWTSEVINVEWLKTVFIPQTAPRDPLEARLLILDGHSSHEILEFM